MILFRSYRNRILLASLAFALFGAIQASFILPASTISKENVDVNVNLVNGVAIRILDSAATAEITELDLSATAAPTGTFVADDFKVEVSTANKTGYKLYMSSSYQDTSTSTYTTDLVNQTNTSYTISTVPVATTKTDLGTAAPGSTNANKWAYSLDDATYSPVPANSAPTQIGSHDTPTAGTKTPVYIGMNVNVEKPSGVYKNQLTFSAVGNPITTDYSLYFLPGTTDPTEVSNLPPTQTASVVAASHTFTIPTLQQYSPTRDGYNFTGYLDESTSTTYQPGDAITVQGDIDYTGSATLTAQWGIVSSTLTVDPNGGTWSGSTSTQTFPGDYGDTKVIANPSASYTISYNDNSQSATYSPNPPAPTSVSRPFTGWTLTATGGGSPSGSFDTTTNTYTYNIASDALTAGYNTTSNTFTLPTITKTGHTCTWHENSASGTSHTSGETNVTISANTEFFAVCTANPHNVTVTAGTGIASTTGSGSHDYGTNVAIGATLSAGYHFANPKWTVNSGGVTISNDSFIMPDNDVSVTANGAINTCSIHYNVNTPSGTTSSGSTADSNFNYNTVTATTANGFSATGYNWAGWAESAGGTAVITTSGGNITATQAASWCGTHGTTKQLYAKWTKKYTYTLNLNKNDGTSDKQILNYPSSGGTTDTSHTFTNLNSYAPTRTGYNFLGWATTSTGTTYVTSRTLNSSSAGSTPSADGFPVTDNLYAIWERTYTITVNASTGATVSTGQGGPWASSITLTFKNSDTSKTFFVKTDSGYAFDQIGNCGQGYSCSGGTPGQTGTIAIYVAGTSGSMWTGSMTAQVLPTLQNQTAINTCKNAATGTTYNLYDSRDGEKYTVAKLADGKCWMTQNLRLVGPKNLTTSDSDVPSSGFSLTASDSGTWCTDSSAACDNQSMVLNSGSDTYGSYYNWYAATAGTGKYETSSGSVSNSICPRGWRLPTGGSSGEFQTLYGYYNSVSAMMSSPVNFVLSGFRFSSSTFYQGSDGLYWSSTAYDSRGAYYLYLLSSDVRPADDFDKYGGFTVRCVAR